VKKDWKKDRAAGAKHARLIRRKPELREALYGTPRVDLAKQIETLGADSLLPDWRASKTRETAHKEGQNDG
jgi:hypothetical protein